MGTIQSAAMMKNTVPGFKLPLSSTGKMLG